MTETNRPDRVEDARWTAGPNAPARSAESPDDDRTMAMLAWALLLAGIVTFIAGVVAVVIAYVKRGGANPLWRSHYDGVVRMFWIWLVLTIIGTPLILLLGLGYLILGVAAIWTAVVGVVGLFRAAENRPA